MTCATIYLASRNYDNHHFSWDKLFLGLVTIEVLWFVPYDWNVSSVGSFPMPLLHYGVILVIALIVADIVRWYSYHTEVRPVANGLPYTIDTISDYLYNNRSVESENKE